MNERIDSIVGQIDSRFERLEEKIDHLNNLVATQMRQSMISDDHEKRITRIEAMAWKFISIVLGAVLLALLGLVLKNG